MAITIKEVAELAGVSKATVSRVLNGSKPVNDETKKKVMEVVKKTGYKPSSIARSLVNKKTQMIGVLIPDISNPFYSVLVKGMSKVANEHNQNIILCNSFNDHSKEMEYLALLEDKQVEGIIFMTTNITKKHIDFLKKYKKPVVTVNRKFKVLDIPNIDINNFKASYDATKYLIDLKHRDIAIIRANLKDEISGTERLAGYKKALKENGLKYNKDYEVEGNFKAYSGYSAMKRLLKLKKTPTAVFCVNDEMACGAIKAIVDSGLKVPDDISIIGFDDVPIATTFIPSLTTISQPIYEMGEKAMETIYKIEKEGKKEDVPFLNHKLIIRESTKEYI